MTRPSTADAAQVEHRDLAHRVATLGALPGEASLDAREQGWAELLDGPPNELAAAIDAARLQWVLALSRDGGNADASRLLAMRDLMELLDAARLAGQHRSRTSNARMNAWPGWSLSPQATAGMLARVRDRLPQLANLVMRSDPADARDAIDEVRTQANALLLFSALDQYAEKSGLGPEPSTPDAAIWSLTFGPPDYDDTFLVSLRADIAHVCRYAEEAFAPPTEKGTKVSGNISTARSYCNEIAAQVLENLATR